MIGYWQSVIEYHTENSLWSVSLSNIVRGVTKGAGIIYVEEYQEMHCHLIFAPVSPGISKN